MAAADTTQVIQPASSEQSPFSEADYECSNDELVDLIGVVASSDNLTPLHSEIKLEMSVVKEPPPSSSPLAPSENENSRIEKDLDDALKKEEFLFIEENVTTQSLTNCKTNALLKSFEVNKKLKDKAKSLGPEQEEFQQLADSVGEFSTALIDPLKSDDDKRRSFEGCFDIVLQKAIQWDQKKFIAHPVVDNLLQSMWYGPFLKLRKSPWSKSGYWGFVLLTILTLPDVFVFPILFAFLSLIRVSNNYRRKRKAMEISFNLVLKDTEDTTVALIESSICYLIQQYGYQKGDYHDPQRQDEGPNNGISLRKFVNDKNMAVTKIAATTSRNQQPERKTRVVLFNDVTIEHRKKLQEIKNDAQEHDPDISFVPVCVGKNVRMKELKQFESLYFEDYVAPSTVGKAIIQKLEGKDVFEHYMDYFTIPWFIFVRDTLSYLTLLSLHFVICLSPSMVAFSNIEWAVFVFFLGLILMEVDQFVDISNEKEKANNNKKAQRSEYQSVSRTDEDTEKESNAKESNAKQFVRNFQNYFSEHWNRLDIGILIVYVITFILRMIAWGKSEQIPGNRLLAAAHFFYGLNASLLTLRAIGHVMERIRGMGAILIALFRIVEDVGAIVCQFIVTIIGFSIAITSVYVAEQSYAPNANVTEEELVCSAPGLKCWWSVMLHLCWSLVGLADRDTLKSIGGTSLSLVYLLYGLFLIIAVILLVNMMIALLSNTYDRVEDNALKEWSFEKAESIKTYSLYHPVPVPFNILSIPAVYLFQYWRRCRCRGHRNNEDGFHQDGINEKRKEHALDDLIEKLEPTYFATHGYSFPLTGEGKMDQLLHEVHGNRSMANHISRRLFRERGLGQRSLEAGPIVFQRGDELCPLQPVPSFTLEGSDVKAWASEGIEIEGYQLTCTDIEDSRRYGARYKTPFSKEMPRMELLILEGGERRVLGIGAVFKDYKFWWMPGWRENSVGYHADHGTIFEDNSDKGRKVDDAMAYRGDLMACEVDFNEETEVSVPVLFYLNGRQVGSATVKYTTGQRELFPYIGMGYKGIRVLAKMCPRRGSPSPIEEFYSERTKEEIKKTIQVQFKVIEDKWRRETERMLQTMHDERKKEMEELKSLLKEYGQRSQKK